jgi:hypothetical protein
MNRVTSKQKNDSTTKENTQKEKKSGWIQTKSK